MEPFLTGPSTFTHGITFGGHPVQCAIALKNIEIMKRERVVEHVAETADSFRATLGQLLDLPIVGDLRGTGFFYAVELVTRQGDEGGVHRRAVGAAAARLPLRRAVRARADLPRRRPRRPGDPDLPAAVAGQAEFDEMTGILGDVLAEASNRIDGGRGAPASDVREGA